MKNKLRVFTFVAITTVLLSACSERPQKVSYLAMQYRNEIGLENWHEMLEKRHEKKNEDQAKAKEKAEEKKLADAAAEEKVQKEIYQRFK